MFVCAIVAASVLAGCVTTQTGTSNATNTISGSVLGRPATISGADNSSTTPISYLVTIEKVTIYAEAAHTPAEIETGLMNRTSLEENAGMLFIFPKEYKASFWMKYTLIPLDIVFITKDKRVLDVVHTVPPCTADPCTTYTSNAPIKYALEVNAGFAEQHRIASGDIVVITPLG